MGPWTNSNIGEIDIAVTTPPGVNPLTTLFPVDALQGIIETWNNTPSIDMFGQWNKDDWPGKVHDVSELFAAYAEEEARYEYEQQRGPNRFDPYGGAKYLGIQSAATGQWRLEKINGKWWFITPDGWPFIMIGVCSTSAWGVNTVEYPPDPALTDEFAWLPDKSGEFASCWENTGDGIWRFDFFAANLYRYYGVLRGSSLRNLIRRRFLDWGFNSLGKWAGGEVETMQFPFIEVVGPSGSVSRIQNGSGSSETDWWVEDPWDPGFAAAVESAVISQKNSWGDNPYYIGFTVKNEGWWDNISTDYVLSSVPAIPAKEAFVNQLEGAYGTITALNSQCSMSWPSFAYLLGIDLTPYSSCLATDISTFIESAAERYYNTWRTEVDQHDPGRLILGSSFVINGWWLTCPEWVQGSVSYCDALMLDHYWHNPQWIIDNYVEPYAVPADKPILVGEYSATTTERGFQASGSHTASQTGRGITYRNYNETLFAHPHWVGSLWFQYRDFPVPGIGIDGYGESNNYGLVDTCNLPYYDMIDEMKKTNKTLYHVHAGQNVTCDDVAAFGWTQKADVDKNCYVDFQDLLILVTHWLRCNDPQTPGCETTWPLP
jgi:hypothetical protein